MHDQLLAILGYAAAESDGSANIKAAIIAAVAVVIAAAIPVLRSTREREPRAVREARTDMRRQRDWWKRKSEWQDDYITELEAVVWRDTGRDPRVFKPPGEPQ